MWAESLFTEDLFADSVSRIREDLQERGFYAVDVQFDVTDYGDRQDVVFLVDRGRVVRVGRVIIHGAAEVPDDRIRKQMLTRQRSLFGKGTFNPMELKDDTAAIRNLYLDQGFLDVHIEAPRIRLNATADEVEIHLYITEGQRYTVASIDFVGDEVTAEERLSEWCEMAPGDAFSDTELLEAEARIRRGLDGLGYPGAKVRGRFDVGENDVRVAIEVQAGPQMRVAEVRISGNELTKDHVILKEVGLEPGDLLSRERVLRAQHRLYRLDVFRNVRIGYEKAPGRDATDYVVHVQVEEDRPLNVTVGVGYNTESRLRFTFATSQDNLHGRARSFGFQGEISDILKRIQFLARTPRLFGAAVPGLASVLWEQESRTGFRVERRSTAIRADHRFNERWRAFLRYSFQRIDLLDVSDAGEVLEEKLEDVMLGDVGIGLFRATLDNIILPTRGNYFNLNFRVFAKPFLSERDFVTARLTEMHTWTFDNGTTFVTAFRVGFAPTFADTEVVPISERFFAGGDSTNRGFARDRLGPTLGDVDPDDFEIPGTADLSQPVGGEAQLLLNQEFRFPLVRRFRLTGNVYLRLTDFNPFDLRHTLGAGLRLETPVGPLRAEYGWKLDREAGESGGEFHFAIGTIY
jgi:outer membrane protein assembly complex protein YaeT